MNIRPTEPRQTPGPGTSRTGETAATRPTTKDPSITANPGERAPGADQVELSEAARRLQETLGLDERTVAQLAPERMKEILARLASGFYHRDEVRDEVLRRASVDLAGGDTGDRHV